jgi:hypothetical protein
VETKAHLCFFKKGRGALWVCLWNQGGRWTEEVWEPLEQSMTKKACLTLGFARFMKQSSDSSPLSMTKTDCSFGVSEKKNQKENVKTAIAVKQML